MNKRGRNFSFMEIVRFILPSVIVYSPPVYALLAIDVTGADNVVGYNTLTGSDVVLNGSDFGTIEVEATGTGASGVYTSVGRVFINGEFGTGGLISVTAGNYSAYGLRSINYLTTGDINGTITVEVGKNSAYGLFGNSTLTTGVIGGDITVTGTGSDSTYIFGLFTYSNLTTGDISGTITTEAGNSQAYGMLCAGGTLATGDISGTITTTAIAGDYAYSLYSADGPLTTGNISGTITATAGRNNAYGLSNSGGFLITTGNISGTIAAEAGNSHAYGMLCAGGTLATGDISGTITATAIAGDYAYGLYNADGSLTTGDISGTISATAGGNKAYGLYAYDDSITTGVISGTIRATASDYAYGILAYDAINIKIAGGTVSATAAAGHAWAIYSGNNIGSSQDADDTVEIVSGSTIVGNIDLASTTDSDALTLSGNVANSTVLNDDIANVETINITGGQWNINGTVSNNLNGIYMTNGILYGTGTIEGLRIDGGTLSPGNSIGTMTINGNLTLNSSSILNMEISESSYDQLIVSGTATLDGTLEVTVVGSLSMGTAYYPLIDAGTLAGAFDTVDLDVPGGTPLISCDFDNSTGILETIMSSFSSVAQTRGQSEIGYILDNHSGSGDDLSTVGGAIQSLSSNAAIQSAYREMMSQDTLNTSEMALTGMRQFTCTVTDRNAVVWNYSMAGDDGKALAASDNSLAVVSQEQNVWMPFAKVFGSWGSMDSDKDVTGYDYNLYGMAAGADRFVTDNVLLGISLGGSYAKMDYDQPHTNTDIDTAYVSLYGSYIEDDWHADLTGTYGHSWYNSRRGIHFGTIDRTAKSDHEGDMYSLAVEAGKNLGGETMIFESIAGLGYSSVHQRGYREKNAGALSLNVDRQAVDGFYSKLGLRTGKEFRSTIFPDAIWVPEAHAFWIHDFSDRTDISSSFASGDTFTVQGRDLERDSLNLGFGLNTYFRKDWRLFVNYDWQTSSSFNSHTLQAGVQWSF